MEQSGNTDLFDLHLDQSSINYLSEAARWSRFLSIIGFIYCGLLVLCGLFIGTIMSTLAPAMGNESAFAAMGSVFMGFFIFSMALLLFFPAYYLYNFSTKLRRAVQHNDQPVLTESLKNLKSFFKFYGILVIVLLSFYILIFIAGIIGALVGHRG
jgi:Na+/H+ antiporter NhaC